MQKNKYFKNGAGKTLTWRLKGKRLLYNTLKKISRHFEVYTDSGKFLFASKDSGKILKVAREHIGNEKIVRLPTLIQTILGKLKRKN